LQNALVLAPPGNLLTFTVEECPPVNNHLFKKKLLHIIAYQEFVTSVKRKTEVCKNWRCFML